MTTCHVVTTHNVTSKPETWRNVKGRVIARYGTITKLAHLLGRHPNAIRGAVEGKCPKVLTEMRKLDLL